MRSRTYRCKKCGYMCRRSTNFHRQALCPHGHGPLARFGRKAKNRKSHKWGCPPRPSSHRRPPMLQPNLPYAPFRLSEVCATCGGPLRYCKTAKTATRFKWEKLECVTHPEHDIFVRKHR